MPRKTSKSGSPSLNRESREVGKRRSSTRLSKEKSRKGSKILASKESVTEVGPRTLKRKSRRGSRLDSTESLSLGNAKSSGIHNRKRIIAVITSGGDSQGMNATVRAVVRTALYLGCKAYFIKEGYQGMVDGGDHIVKADWISVSGIIHKGGTIIGTGRCKEFRERPGRLKAAYNLVTRGITNLVVIGGDGSLRGANALRQQWSSLLDELYKQDHITAKEYKNCSCLNIVGIVGSIDNDFCGTDMTIGTDSALHRILESVDAIVTTASSHQRTFILEVMGRHCGYLALVAALASEADFVFIPEWPPEVNWAEGLCTKLKQERELGQRLNIILVAEGAIDRNGNAITADMVKNVVVENLKQDTRITVLGHVQRGGSPSAFDRLLGSRMGTEAVLALLDAKPNSEAYVISLVGNQLIRLPLMACVEKTNAIADALSSKQWNKAVKLRGATFRRNLEAFKVLTQIRPPSKSSEMRKRIPKLGVMHIGSPCCGINAALRSFVRIAIYNGASVVGIGGGIDGLIEGDVRDIGWADVNGLVGQGGAFLGTRRTLLNNDNIGKVISRLKEIQIEALLLIGGFEAYTSALTLAKSKDIKIPICVIPATISNNMPGSEFSLGADTAVNEITEICDRIRQSAQGTKRRVFIVETMGGFCGYLATVAGLAGGADAAYIFEEKFTIKDLIRDAEFMKTKMAAGVRRGLILRNEFANQNYSTDFVFRLFSEEGKGKFSCRINTLGHLQQGGSPSPFDRNLGTKLAAAAAEWLLKQIDSGSEAAALLGLNKRQYRFTPLQELEAITDFNHRIPKKQWWLKLRPLLQALGRHETCYEENAELLPFRFLPERRQSQDELLGELSSVYEYEKKVSDA